MPIAGYEPADMAPVTPDPPGGSGVEKEQQVGAVRTDPALALVTSDFGLTVDTGSRRGFERSVSGPGRARCAGDVPAVD